MNAWRDAAWEAWAAEHPEVLEEPDTDEEVERRRCDEAAEPAPEKTREELLAEDVIAKSYENTAVPPTDLRHCCVPSAKRKKRRKTPSTSPSITPGGPSSGPMAQHAPADRRSGFRRLAGDTHGTRERFPPTRLSLRNDASAAAQQPQEMRGVHALVKWESPADEVRGIAAGAAVLLAITPCCPIISASSVPNRTWAVSWPRPVRSWACAPVSQRPAKYRAVALPSSSTSRAPKRNVEWLFVVGCTEGLMPTAAATGDDKASRAAQEEQRAAFARLVAGDRAPCGAPPISLRRTLPWLIRFAFPTAARSPATVSPLPSDSHALHQRMGAARPTTVGSQRFLRDAGLN